MSGPGITMKEKDTVVEEKLKIVQKGSDQFYVADIKEDGAPVYFKLAKITASEFTCEIPEHDFPK
jgi:hypothetical protein